MQASSSVACEGVADTGVAAGVSVTQSEFKDVTTVTTLYISYPIVTRVTRVIYLAPPVFLKIEFLGVGHHRPRSSLARSRRVVWRVIETWAIVNLLIWFLRKLRPRGTSTRRFSSCSVRWSGRLGPTSGARGTDGRGSERNRRRCNLSSGLD